MSGFFPPISLLNISVYRLQPRLFLDPCQWFLMSLITGNKVKKKPHKPRYCEKRKGQSQQKNFEKFN
jgi:hypothetical protein